VGRFSATLDVVSDDRAHPRVSVPLTGNGVSQTLQLSTTSLDFGALLVGNTSSVRNVSVTNAGTRAVKLTLGLNGAGESQFALSPPPPGPILVEPGTSITQGVTFTPSANAEAVASLKITPDEPLAPQASVDLRGQGVSSVISVSPARLDFGTVRAPANVEAQSVTVLNVSSEEITLEDPLLEGRQKDHFTSGTLTKHKLGRGESTTLLVSYGVKVAAASEATLTFRPSKPTQSEKSVVVLSGKAVASLLTVSPLTLDFGRLEVGTQSAAKTFTVTNQSSSPRLVESVEADDPAFVVDAEELLATPIPPGKSATFTVVFQPREATAMTGEVLLTLQDEDLPEVLIALSGTGRSITAEGGGCACGSTGAGSLTALALLALMALRTRRIQ
jgi:hypothetical protein